MAKKYQPVKTYIPKRRSHSSNKMKPSKLVMDGDRNRVPNEWSKHRLRILLSEAPRKLRKDWGRPVKKKSRRGKHGLNRCGHRRNPR